MAQSDGQYLEFETTKRIRDYGDNVTFVELKHLMRDLIPVDGSSQILCETDRNVIIWSGLSDELADLVLSLRDKGQIAFHRTSVNLYFIDGCVLDLPLALRLPKDGYKKPHWLPTSVRLVSSNPAHRRRTVARNA